MRLTEDKKMKIFRLNFKTNERVVIRNNATMDQWYKLVGRAAEVAKLYATGFPVMVQWNGRFHVTTKTGNDFCFYLERSK